MAVALATYRTERQAVRQDKQVRTAQPVQTQTAQQVQSVGQVQTTQPEQEASGSMFPFALLLFMLVVVGLVVWLMIGHSPERTGANIIRGSVEPYLVTDSDATIRENHYFARTSAGEAVVFDLRLYLADYGAQNVKCSSEYDKATKDLRTTYSFKLGEADVALVSHCFFSDNGKQLYYGYTELTAEYPQRVITAQQHAPRIYTANSEIVYEDNYIVYDRSEAFKFDRVALGQLCYFVQGGFYNYAKLDNTARAELQALGFLFAN